MDGMYEQNQMPHSNEAEQSVLGAIIIDPELINTTQEVLLPESFYRGAHQHIFRAMMHLNEDNKEIDVVTLMDQLSSDGSLVKRVALNISQSYRLTFQQREMFNIIQISSLNTR